MDILQILLVLAVAAILLMQLKAAAARKKTRNSLQESLNYSNMIIDTIPNPLLVLDAQLNIVTGSRSFYLQFNCKKEDIENRPFFEIFTGNFDLKELEKLLMSVINENVSFDHYELELADNRIIWLNARKLYRPHNNVHLMLVGVYEITEMKRIESEKAELLNALEKEKAWMNSIMAQMPSGVSIASAPSGKLIYHNEKAVELLRHPLLPSADYSGYSQYGAMHDFNTPYKPEEYPITRALFGEKIFGEEMLYRRGDGTFTYFWVNALPLLDNDGKIIAAISTFEDIAQKKEVEKALLDAQKLARFGNYSIDVKNNNKIEWSDELYNIWEVDHDKPIPPFEELWKKVHPEDRERLKTALSGENAGSDSLEAEFRIQFPDGRVKYIHIITKLNFDESGNLISRKGVEIDITERKLAQLKLEQSLKDLERSNRELEQFAYVASHDLQEPIRMVSNFLKLLSQKYEGIIDEQGKQYIGFAVDGAKRMNSLIKGLLSYSRITTQAKAPQQVDLNQIVNNVLKDLRSLIEENNAAIEICELPVINAEDVQMHQLFQNLISNAVKFKNQKNPEIKICAGKENDQYLFSVEDNGIGIKPEFFDRIFVIFQRLHETGKYPGTGLGLAICKKIVERHGGRIWVTSEIGKGTTFYFTLSSLKLNNQAIP